MNRTAQWAYIGFDTHHKDVAMAKLFMRRYPMVGETTPIVNMTSSVVTRRSHSHLVAPCLKKLQWQLHTSSSTCGEVPHRVLTDTAVAVQAGPLLQPWTPLWPPNPAEDAERGELRRAQDTSVATYFQKNTRKLDPKLQITRLHWLSPSWNHFQNVL